MKELSTDEIVSSPKLKSLIKEMRDRIEKLENLVFQAKDILNLEEAAMFIGVKRSQLYKLTHSRAIPYFKPSGKLVYFEKSELLDWLKQNPVMSQKQIDLEAKETVSRLSMK
jgi:excisionase family DNA binding protein